MDSITFFLLATLVTLTSESSWAATYYVATTGSDSHSCAQAQSQASPKRTINAALACVGPAGSPNGAGHTVEVADGVYNEQVDDKIPSGTSDSSRFVLKSVRKHGAILRPTYSTATGGILYFQADSKYITVDGFEIDGCCTGAVHTHAIRMSSYNYEAFNFISFINLDIHDIPASAVSFGGARNIYIGHNVIHHVGYGSGTVQNAEWGYGHSIYAATKTRDSIFEYNEFYDSYGYSIHGNDNFVYGDSSNNEIRYNYNHDNTHGAGAILWWSGGNNRIHHNISVRNTSINRPGHPGIGFSSFHDQIYYNNISEGNDYGFYHNGSGDVIKNNIVRNNALADFLNGNYAGDLSNNICSRAGSGCTVIDPLFVDSANGDYRLTAGSPAINAGTAAITSSIVLTNFAGTAPDVGAYEFLEGAPLVDTIAPSVNIASPANGAIVKRIQ
jgi:hypothetical protein